MLKNLICLERCYCPTSHAVVSFYKKKISICSEKAAMRRWEENEMLT